jgi:hypothetical protein
VSALARLARRPAAIEAAPERCDLCGAVVPSEHRHVLDVSTRDLRCACRACSLLFDRPAAAEGRLRLVGDRLLALPEFLLDDLMWEELRLPVDVAFFFRSSVAERVMAFYPSPLGPTESLLTFEAWTALEAANPVLRTMADDVEALLVDRARRAAAVDRADRPVLRARGAHPPALARADRRRRGVAGARPVLRRARRESEDAVKLGKAQTKTDKPTHVAGTFQGNKPGNYESQKGHEPDGRSTAARSTGINVKAREPIDPRMPNLSPG